ncbi:MAG TPA: ribonuclease P protein component [Longimicrobium sp.]|nr:ribonuclease P protein component [Longimicrobium sp.]
MDAAGEPSAGRESFALPRAARITASDEIRSLFRRGKRRKTRHLDAFVSASPAAFPRLGVVVPKHKRTIVERNRVKRRLREIGRTVVLPALRNSGRALDVLVRARPEAYDAEYDALRDELRALTEELCSHGP